MIMHEIKHRVRYAETDQMRFVYYANYAVFFEMGRVELIRSLGVTYKDIEESGVAMPVLDLQIKFLKPAYYDQLLTIKTMLKEIPNTRIKLEYEILNRENTLLTLGATTLVFIDGKTLKPVHCPDILLAPIKKHWNK